jgi:hypothetical protein
MKRVYVKDGILDTAHTCGFMVVFEFPFDMFDGSDFGIVMVD